MRDLVLADLTELDAEPRIHDLALAEALGFGRPRRIRELIERSRAEMARYGDVRATAACMSVAMPNGGQRSVETQAYWLNEPQAVLLCMFARTARAADVREQVINVYLAWRRERADDGVRAALARIPPRPAYPLEDAARRLGPVETQALALALAPVWKNGRRPAFWSDFDVRTLLVETHRQMTVKEAMAICADRYGPARTPSRSAVYRLWMALDAVRACPKAA